MQLKAFMRGAAAVAASASALALTFGAAVPAQAATTTITWLTDSGPAPTKLAKQIVADFQKANPTIKVTVRTRPGGAEADNLVKTKLATGTMEDVFNYNSGSLLSAINPARTLVDLSKESFWNNVYPSFKPAVTVAGKQYGSPWGTAMGGGIYYNVSVLQKAGVSGTPKTWAAFIDAAKKVKASGVDAICGTFADSWTGQLLLLSDYYNVQLTNKNFAADYTANKAKYAYVPAALAGFNKLEETHKLGLYNSDAATSKYSDAGAKIGNGKCGFYPMLTFFTNDIPADLRNNVGFMAQPGTSASTVGLTTWMPSGMYVAKNTKKLAAAKKFVAFVASKAGTDSFVKANGYSGPFLTKDQSAAPANVPLPTKHLSLLIKGKSAPALEYISPIKGPNLPNISVQVLTGQISGKQGAALYDQDVVAQAQQLGLKGW